MNKLDLKEVVQYVEINIGTFHNKRIERLKKLKLKTILKRKNPYLFKAKNILTANEIIVEIANAYVSSAEETIFGDWLEGLAIFINKKVYDGWKSGIPNIDLEFDKDGKRYIVNIKSGPNWGNSKQIDKMKYDFKTAQRTLRTSNSKITVFPVNGCCYGIENKTDKGDYFKFCGQKFWEFISGNKNLYHELIVPLGYMAKERNDEFKLSFSKMINMFTKEFIDEFCSNNGEIDWKKLVEFNSGH